MLTKTPYSIMLSSTVTLRAVCPVAGVWRLRGLCRAPEAKERCQGAPHRASGVSAGSGFAGLSSGLGASPPPHPGRPHCKPSFCLAWGSAQEGA